MRRVLVFLSGHLGRVLVGTSIIALSLVASPFLSPAAHAELAGCYTDPVVTLSNGTALDLSDTIGDTFTDVQRVLYVLHGPAGTWVTGVVSTAGPIGPKEAFYYIPDGAPDQYAVVSKVTTSSSGISVVASATVTTILDTASASDSGWNNQQLKISLSP